MNEDKKTRKAPAFQFYADDFLAGTADMAAEEVGGYIRLLCHQWSKGGIPSDEERSARIAGLIGSPSIRYVLAKFTLCDGDTLKNARLEQIRQEQADYKSKQASSGKTGAQKRWDKVKSDGNPNGVAIATPMATPMANGWRSDSSPSPSSTPKKKDTEAPKSPWEVSFGVELPESLRTDSCLQAVKLWLQYKSEKREGYKKTGLSTSLTKWSREFTAADFPTAVENSIASGWKGIFPKKDSQQSLPINSNGSTKLSMDISQYQ